VTHSLRAYPAIFNHNPAANASQPLAHRSPRAFAVPRSRHPAATRIVQQAFGIGMAMQKALSVILAPHFNIRCRHELEP
jgi:hypothetical protein